MTRMLMTMFADIMHKPYIITTFADTCILHKPKNKNVNIIFADIMHKPYILQHLHISCINSMPSQYLKIACINPTLN